MVVCASSPGSGRHPSPTPLPTWTAAGEVDFADFFLFAEHFGQPAWAKLVAMARQLIGLPEGLQLRQNALSPELLVFRAPLRISCRRK